MILRLGPRVLSNLLRGHAIRMVAGPSLTPPFLTPRAAVMSGGMRISHMWGLLPTRNFAIKTQMSEPTFHSVADRTIQRFIDLFDR